MSQESEEALREAACVGNAEEIEELLKIGVNVNSSNKVNGWTALHWACKRGHVIAVEKLVQAGSDKNAKNSKGEVPADLTGNNKIREILGAPPMSDGDAVPNSGGFMPNYLANPVFPHATVKHADTNGKFQQSSLGGESLAPQVEKYTISNAGFLFRPLHVMRTEGDPWCPSGQLIHPDFIVLRVRLAYALKSAVEFIEIEINRDTAPSLQKLKAICCERLDAGIGPEDVKKVRKLPNIILRDDADVRRLTDYQSLELVLHSHVPQPMPLHPITNVSEHAETRYMRDQASKFVY